jgi:hypothetical protein
MMKYLKLEYRDYEPDSSFRLSSLASYYKSLDQFDLKEHEDVLMYFGGGFLHDSHISSFKKFKTNSLEVTFSSNNFKEDIESYCEENGIRKPRAKYYKRNEIKCVALFNNYKCSKLETEPILAVEIDIENPFTLRFLTWSHKEFELRFDRCKVNISSTKKIRRLTRNNLESFPYCDSCIENLMNIDKLKERVQV